MKFTNNSPIAYVRDVPYALQLANLRISYAMAGASICPGIKIVSEAIVASDTIFPKNVLPRIIVARNPVRKIKNVESKSFIKKKFLINMESRQIFMEKKFMIDLI